MAALPSPHQGGQLTLGNEIGKGHFGVVYKGTYADQNVAVKMLNEWGNMSPDSLRQEAAVMKSLSHPNIVSFIALEEQNGKLAIVMEYLENGSLTNYLTEGAGRDLDTGGLVRIIKLVAEGMAYLERMDVIHRDLAARNVLVGANGVCKVSDFGMTRILDNYYYFAAYGTGFPVKWTAPEAFVENKFSIKSDVWSFGMLCYEIVTKGNPPFPDLTMSDVQILLQEAYKNPSSFRPKDVLPKPGGCPESLYKVMLSCWTVQRGQRPYISDLLNQIKQI